MQSRINPECGPAWLVRAQVLLLFGLSGLFGPVGWSQTPATAVALQLPSAIAFDAKGNLYIAERGGHIVHRVAPDGSITAVAGTGTQGFTGDGGPATAAELDSPSGVAVDPAGNVFIADTHNHRIRKLTLGSGVLETVAGSGVRGYSGDNGAATSAELDSPTALGLGANGDIYLADTGNHRIRRVAAATGVITTVAGNGVQGFSGDGGPAVAAAVDSPTGLALDAAGNLYLADTHNHRIRRVDAGSGLISTRAGVGPAGPGLPLATGDKASGTSAAIALPRGLTVAADGSVYFADSADHRIRRIAADGAITTVAGLGAEGFAGDGAPAIKAALDSPGAVALSAGGLVTLADPGNQRVRQVDAALAPGPDIHTIAGLGAALSAGGLALSGPAVISYGGGTLTATLASPGAATGRVTFLDTSTASPVTLGALALVAGSAILSTATLPAGTHRITASYSGDATHGAAQSQALLLAVQPLAIDAVAQPVSILYGQAVPTVGGSVSGVLPQDSGMVSAVFSTTAAALSPAGVYPIAATLTGPADGNYTLRSVSGAMTIGRAPTSIVILASLNSVPIGVPVSFTVQAVSSTAGTPTGSVTLLDGGTVVGTVSLVSGSGTYTVTSLASGAHSLTAVYAGDGNFLGSTLVAAPVAVGAGPDFNLTSTGSSAQSIPSGSSAIFGFAVTQQGGILASPITLAVQGLPVGATASMNPAYLPPGGQVTAFTLTVQTTKTVAQRGPNSPGSRLTITLGGPILLVLRRRMRRLRRVWTRFSAIVAIFASMLCIVFATLSSGCGDRVNTGADVQAAPTYNLFVTGTATSATGTVLKHTASVTLQVL